jgi:hypothetical protein
MTQSNLIQSVRSILTGAKPSFGQVWGVFNRFDAPTKSQREKVVLPEKVVPTPEQEKALAALPDLLTQVTWPQTKRVLRPAEQSVLVDLVKALREVEALSKAVRASARTTVLNHGDLVLEEKSLVTDETPRDKDGHYLATDEATLIGVSGAGSAIGRSVTNPSLQLSAQALESRTALADDKVGDDEISRKEYNAVTRSVRTLDEGKLLAYLNRNPERAEVFMDAVTQSGGSLSMLEKNTTS